MTPPVFVEAGPVKLHPVEVDPPGDSDEERDSEDGYESEAERESDIAFCTRLVNDHRVRQGLTLYGPKTRAEEREFVESMDEDVRFIVRADGDRVGVVDLVHVDGTHGTGELGYFFDPDAWGNGYATAAADGALDYAFAQRRLHKVVARAIEPNDASRRVIEKLGFTREGVLRDEVFVDGEHADVHRYGLLEAEWERG